MVQRMTMPGGPSATALAREIGVPQSTLSRWIRVAPTGTLGGVTRKKTRKGTGRGPTPAAETPSLHERPRRPDDLSPEEKLRLVLEASGLSDDELGAFLRREGLHEADLEQWRDAMRGALSEPSSRHGRSREARRIRKLERELRRKDKALAEAAALLVLQKKVQALWGDEDDDTTPESDE